MNAADPTSGARRKTPQEGSRMHSFVKKLIVCMLAFGFVGTAVAEDKAMKKEAAPAKKSLYDRLGGKDAIKAVIDEFVANVVADKRINKFFAKADAAKLKGALVDQVCMATGGP